MKTDLQQRNIRALMLALCVTAAPAFGATFNTNTTIGVGDTTYEGQAIEVNNCVLTVNGSHAFASLWLTNNAVLTHSADLLGSNGYRLQVTLTGDCLIDAGSRIDVSGCGYRYDAGPGAGMRNTSNGAGTGAGHGGNGGTANGGVSGAANGDLIQPITLGSGGGDVGGNGGGAVRLAAGGTMRVDGQVLAHGLAPAGGDNGGGAGGSLWLVANVLEGGGSIAANGGNSTTGGGGGGGRIAVFYGSSTFTGSLSAVGGAGTEYGGAGTVYTKPASAPAGQVMVDNANHAGQWTPLTTPEPFALTIANQAWIDAPTPLTTGTLVIRNNGLLARNATVASLSVTVQGDATIEIGGRLDLGGRGHPQRAGPSPGIRTPSGWGTGGGHGGVGGTSPEGGAGGSVYGSIPTPIACGSGGGDYTGGAGGGAVRLSVTGTLRIDGLLSVAAPAANTEDGGGAGGSLWIDATGLTGSGVLTAAGGASASSGGGAGGRIALYLTSNAFAGSLTAAGGSCYASGGPGTIYTQLVGAAVAQVVIDNGGSSGLTRLNQTLWPVGQSFDLLLAGMAHLRPTEPLSFTSLSMAGGALISHEQATAGFHLTTSGNVSIPAGCAINVSGLGPLAGQGAGPGARHPWGWGSGAGHGGKGQDWSYTSGGLPYGSATQPVTLGSGGGDGYGGSGGGAVRLSVGGSLLLDGTITANGNPPGGGGDDGGGSGGSIWLTADSLAGAGWLTADGGASISGGNGAGGRIAVYAYDRSGFNPAQISAIGPGDAGEGSVFLTVPLSQPTCHRVGDNVQLEWRAGTGVLYQVQTTTTLTTNDWHNFGNPIPGINGMLSVPCPIGADPRRFYRVGLSP